MEEVNTEAFAESLMVPSVQELVAEREALVTIPPRYLLSQPLDAASVPSDGLQVPVINLQALLNGDPLQLQVLHCACKDWGFFQVVNHGVSSSLLERFKVQVKDFFNIPMEEKKKLWMTPAEYEGFGHNFIASEEQKLDWADGFTITTLPQSNRNPHLFPMLPLPFRDTLDCYSIEVQKLTSKIIDSIGQALGEETWKYFKELFKGMGQAMRINYYPPCPQPDKVIGSSPHSDGDAITILLQLNEMDGLQIRKDGGWISVNPLPNAFVVNLGDIFEILTNGTYRSIEHRAVVNQRKDRLSVAAFHNPSFEREIGPSPSLVTQVDPARYCRIKTVDFLKGFFARKLEGKSYLDVMRIQ